MFPAFSSSMMLMPSGEADAKKGATATAACSVSRLSSRVLCSSR